MIGLRHTTFQIFLWRNKMKITKNFIAIVLCLLLVTTSYATVSAEDSKSLKLVSKTVEVLDNGDVEVLIDIADNPGISSLSLSVSYDRNALTFKENGFVDTELMVGKLPTTLTENPFRLSWNHTSGTPENNYKNGTVAKLYFKANAGFYGETEISVIIVSSQTIVNNEIARPSYSKDVVKYYVTRDRLSIKDGEAFAYGLNGENLIIASYDEDSMVDCKVYPNGAGDVQIKVADVLDLSGATIVKAFLWEDLETCIPVCNHAEELNITDIN